MTNYQPESLEPQSPMEPQMPVAPPKRRMSGKLLSGIVVLALLGVLGVGAAVILPTLFKAKQNIPKLMAGDTQFFASINPNLSALKGFKNLQDSYKNLGGTSGSGGDLNQQLEDTLGVNFKDDVQPWLGTEMAVGISGISNVDANANATEQLVQQAKTVFVLATRDKTKSEAFLQKLRTKQGADGAYSDETYKNVKLATRARSGSTEGKPLNAMGLVGDYVVISSDTDVLKGIVDRAATPQNTLSDNPRFKNVLAGLPQTAIGYVYVDGLPISEAMTKAIDEQMQSVEGAQRDQLNKNLVTIRALEGLGASVSVEEQGLAFDADVKLDMTKLDAATKQQYAALGVGVGPGVLGTVGQGALASITGNVPETFKQQILDLINSQPDGKEQLGQMEEQFGINLERDLLDWFKGDFALVALPADEAKGLGTPATGYFALRTPEKDKAKAGLKNIESAIDKSGAIPSESGSAFSDGSFGGQQWRAVKDPDGKTVFGYGFVGDDLVLGVGEDALVFAPAGTKQPLVNDANFKIVQANLPTKNGGVVYFNVPEIVKIAAAAQGQTVEQYYASESGKGVKPIKGVGVAGVPGIDANGVGKARVFVLINNQ